MRIRFLAAAAALVGAVAQAADPASHLSLNGTTGLVRVPVADTLEGGQLDFGVGNLDPIGTLASPRVHGLAVGLYPWLEVNARLVDGTPAVSPAAGVRDLSAGLKLRLFDGGAWPSLAVGVQDLQGNRLLPGYFATSSWSWHSVRITGGYGRESALLSGGFGGIDWSPWPWLVLAAEHTARADTAAVRLVAGVGQRVSIVGTAAADMNGPRDRHYGLSLSVPLEHLGTRSLTTEPAPAPVTEAHEAGGPGQLLRPVELILQPNLITFVGTDFGSFEADLSARVRLQAPLSDSTMLTTSLLTPAVRSPDFEPGGVFAANRSRAGLDQAFVQHLARPGPAWYALTSVGALRVLGDLGAALLSENVVLWGDGRNVGRLNLGAFADADDSQGMLIGEYRRQSADRGTSVGLAAGQFAAGDRGGRVDLTRFFGDTAVTLFVKGYGRGNDAAGGIALSMPLGAVPRDRSERFIVRGGERWGHSLQSTFGGSSGANLLRPDLLVEVRPDRNLRDSVLDWYRGSPARPVFD